MKRELFGQRGEAYKDLSLDEQLGLPSNSEAIFGVALPLDLLDYLITHARIFMSCN